MMKNLILLLFLVLLTPLLSGKDKVNVYLFPGQGSDHRIFKNFDLDTTKYNFYCVEYGAPLEDESLKQFAHRLSHYVDTLQPFILVGVSLGGMICVELAHYLNPEKVFIISSAKKFQELPARYKIQQRLKLYQLLAPGVYKTAAQVLQPIVEPDRRFEKETCKAMLKAKTKRYFKRTVALIIEWGREQCTGDVVHIHGSNDHTIPISNLQADHVIQGGSHMMTLTHAEEITTIIYKEMNTKYWN